MRATTRSHRWFHTLGATTPAALGRATRKLFDATIITQDNRLHIAPCVSHTGAAPRPQPIHPHIGEHTSHPRPKGQVTHTHLQHPFTQARRPASAATPAS